MNRYLTEFIGTFFLVLTIGLSVLSGSALAPIAIGSGLMVMVYMGGHISGAHYNPAVSLAILMRGKMDLRDFVPYLIAQVLGAMLAAGAVLMILGTTFAPAPAPEAGIWAVLLAEFLFTFALALVVLHVATADDTDGNDYYGLAIGFTVMTGAFAVGPVSGGVFNPAVGTGPILISALAGGGSIANLWIYLVAPFIGGAAAAIVFRIQTPDQAVQ
ncbi:MAG: MIP/aquaporin family protein [Gemmatimonadota bacterium]|nr:MAG: MIP/aquaporin family protein [Gemmatimonadota bacterium]